MGRYKESGSFLWYAPQLSGTNILSFLIPVPPGCMVRGSSSDWLLDGGHPVSILRSSGLTKAGGCRLQHRSFTSTAGNIFSLTTVFHDATQASVTSAMVGIFTPEKSAEGPLGPLSRLFSVPRGHSHHQRSLHIWGELCLPCFRFQALHRRDWGPPPAVSHPSPPPLQASCCAAWPPSGSGRGPARRSTCVHSPAAWQNSHSTVSRRSELASKSPGRARSRFLLGQPLTTTAGSFRTSADASCCTLQQILWRSERGISLYPVTTVSASRWVWDSEGEAPQPWGPPGQCDKNSENVLPGMVLSTLYKLSPLILTPVFWGGTMVIRLHRWGCGAWRG